MLINYIFIATFLVAKVMSSGQGVKVLTNQVGMIKGKTIMMENKDDIKLMLDEFDIAAPSYRISEGGNVSQCPSPVFGISKDTCRMPAVKTVEYYGKGSGAQIVQFCVCPDQNMADKYAVEMFGRVPYPLRYHVKQVLIGTKDPSPRYGGYANLDSILMLDKSTLSLFVHESVHTVDRLRITASTEWLQAVADDTCVASYYATANYAECFAEAAIFWTYLVFSGQYDGFESTTPLGCMKNQLNFLAGVFPAVRMLKYINPSQ